ncbi:COG3650 family protein [Halomonas halocynthiae]|uniref:COG3650 family protein n=1 Tax=Halomonas halocynthiae TaxID=176290 RepID=UPI0003FA6775|nr:MliC family protein [Halomonas halocynthiae]
MPKFTRFLVISASALLLTLQGCASHSSYPSGSSGGASTPVPPPMAEQDNGGTDGSTAPLLPSLLFPGEGKAFTGWRCTPDQGLVTANDGDTLRLWSAHGAWSLDPAVVASGERYQQGDLSFWAKGPDATVESSRGRLSCERNIQQDALTRAQFPGVMFRAQGNEPSWVLTLANDVPEIFLSLDYGEREITLPYRVIAMDNAEGRVELASGQSARPFDVRIEAGACFDSMSGQPWPARVELTVNDQTYRGCGQGIAP